MNIRAPRESSSLGAAVDGAARVHGWVPDMVARRKAWGKRCRRAR